MSNLDLVNAYFEGTLSESERQQFADQLSKDPELQHEFKLQQDIIAGIKNARKAELKALLDKVPVGGAASGPMSLAKLTTAIIVAGAVGAGIYFYASKNTDITPEQAHPGIQMPEPVAEASEVQSETAPDPASTTEPETETLPAIDPLEETEEVAPTEPVHVDRDNTVIEPEIRKPEILNSFDSIENDQDSLEAPSTGLMEGVKSNELPAVEIEVDNTRKKYTFHYQLEDGKLYLYGAFDNGLYEILEFNTRDGKTLFLYYKERYYALQRNQSQIVPLEEVQDESLLGKLEQARKG